MVACWRTSAPANLGLPEPQVRPSGGKTSIVTPNRDSRASFLAPTPRPQTRRERAPRFAPHRLWTSRFEVVSGLTPRVAASSRAVGSEGAGRIDHCRRAMDANNRRNPAEAMRQWRLRLRRRVPRLRLKVEGQRRRDYSFAVSQVATIRLTSARASSSVIGLARGASGRRAWRASRPAAPW
jgi:hypothetical protein